MQQTPQANGSLKNSYAREDSFVDPNLVRQLVDSPASRAGSSATLHRSMLLRLAVASLRSIATRCRFDDDRAHHVGMQIAEILVGPRRGEGERITVISVERRPFLEGVVGRP